MICPGELARGLAKMCSDVRCRRSSARPSSSMRAMRAIVPDASPWARGERSMRLTIVAVAVAVAVTLMGFVTSASASLIGAQASYQYDDPTTQSVNYTLPTQTVTPLTTFNDTANGIMSYFFSATSWWCRTQRRPRSSARRSMDRKSRSLAVG